MITAYVCGQKLGPNHCNSRDEWTPEDQNLKRRSYQEWDT